MAKQKKDNELSSELTAALDALNKTYGAGSIVRMTDVPVETERISTGSIILDAALGGGYPKGKIIEIYGPESIGKSTMALQFLANVTGPKLYIDHEQSLDREYANNLGVNLKNLLITQPQSLEESTDIILSLADKVDAIVFDSIAEAAPLREIEGDASTQSTGVKAKLMSQLVRLIKSKENNPTFVFINQIREKIGVMYGSPITTPGGNAMKFGAHIRLDIFGREPITKGSDKEKEILGHYMKIKIAKNKLGVPHGKCEVPLIYDGRGISKEQEILDIGIEKGIIEKSGSWIKYDGTNIAQGIENARTFLIDNPELCDEIIKKIYESK